MNRAIYDSIRRSVRMNGVRYTLSQAVPRDQATIQRLWGDQRPEDMLKWRERWMPSREAWETQADIVRLTAPHHLFDAVCKQGEPK